MDLNDLGKDALLSAERRGQIEPNLNVTLIGKMIGEAGEAIDAEVKGRKSDPDYIEDFDESMDDFVFFSEFEAQVKNTLGDELADVVLYASLIASKNGIDLDKHVQLKNRYNKLRP